MSSRQFGLFESRTTFEVSMKRRHFLGTIAGSVFGGFGCGGGSPPPITREQAVQINEAAILLGGLVVKIPHPAATVIGVSLILGGIGGKLYLQSGSPEDAIPILVELLKPKSASVGKGKGAIYYVLTGNIVEAAKLTEQEELMTADAFRSAGNEIKVESPDGKTSFELRFATMV